MFFPLKCLFFPPLHSFSFPQKKSINQTKISHSTNAAFALRVRPRPPRALAPGRGGAVQQTGTGELRRHHSSEAFHAHGPRRRAGGGERAPAKLPGEGGGAGKSVIRRHKLAAQGEREERTIRERRVLSEVPTGNEQFGRQIRRNTAKFGRRRQANAGGARARADDEARKAFPRAGDA